MPQRSILDTLESALSVFHDEAYGEGGVAEQMPLGEPGRQCSDCDGPLARLNTGTRCYRCETIFNESMSEYVALGRRVTWSYGSRKGVSTYDPRA